MVSLNYMEIREIQNKQEWESFFDRVEDKTFLQSWNWGEFHEKNGAKVWRLGIYAENTLLAVALVAKIKARRGTFLLIQHGPVLVTQGISNFQFPISKKEILEVLLKELKNIGKEEGAAFIRMAPLFERTNANIALLRQLGFRKAPMHANAYDATWKLDIALSEEELLRNMRKTTRYTLRQTFNNPDIEVVKSENPKDIEIYAKLNEEVARRQSFVPFSKSFIEKEFDVFSGDKKALWLFGKYKGEVAAGALVVFWSGVGFYHQAASKGEYAKLSIPYRIQWEAIQEAKLRGCKLYDFWGYVDPAKQPNHPWAGPTLFKIGFGGRAFEYVKTYDYPLSLKYWPAAILETIRARKRGL
ncbi:MAG: peptidoglycan bridge formation glycyltransferase FemA/FemB family protein [Candidatus Wildermuthbacteria bacterium]|nr:peptidoglycan bridge formation glycyltransferase FemA/FemB family protein [Candidatus Wildermuthbacteria bacterium]